MDEYISREAAIKLLERHGLTNGSVIGHHSGKCDIAADLLRSIPAADVQPVKRGKWVTANGSWFTPGGDPVWECSECGKGRHVYGVEHGSYGTDIADGQWVSCPNCGADMREDSK